MYAQVSDDGPMLGRRNSLGWLIVSMTSIAVDSDMRCVDAGHWNLTADQAVFQQTVFSKNYPALEIHHAS